MKKNMDTFTVDGKEYCVVRPTFNVESKATAVYNQALKMAIDSGAYMEIEWSKVVEDKGIWSENDKKELADYAKTINDLENKLKTKGVLTKSQAKNTALKLREARIMCQYKLLQRASLFSNTAESQAGQERLNYLTWNSIKTYPDMEPLFKDQAAFDQNVHEYMDVFVEARTKLSMLMQDYDYMEEERKNPENKFLIKYGYMNENLEFVDKDGNTVGADGKPLVEVSLPDEEGEFIDDSENLDNSEPVSV